MAGGQLRERVAFHRLVSSVDDYGQPTTGFAPAPFCERWCALMPERGRERLEAGRLESAVGAVLKVRSDTVTRTIRASDKAVVDGVDYAIRSITNPDRRDRFIEMTVERGVAV